MFFISHHRSKNVIALASPFARASNTMRTFPVAHCLLFFFQLVTRIMDVDMYNCSSWSYLLYVFSVLLFSHWLFVASFSILIHFIIAISFGKVCHLFYFILFVLCLTGNMNEIHEFPLFEADSAQICGMWYEYIHQTVWMWTQFSYAPNHSRHVRNIDDGWDENANVKIQFI